MSYPTTSQMRVALCGAIVNTIRDASSEWKAWLAERLALVPFESMSDVALIAMAHEVLPADRVAGIVDGCNATRYEIVERGALCRVCHDIHHVPDGDGRWARCLNCNPPPEPTERNHR